MGTIATNTTQKKNWCAVWVKLVHQISTECVISALACAKISMFCCVARTSANFPINTLTLVLCDTPHVLVPHQHTNTKSV